jgi:hypothetical protein
MDIIRGSRRAVIAVVLVAVPACLLVSLSSEASAVPAPGPTGISLAVGVAGASVLPGLGLEVVVPSGRPVNETPFSISMSNLEPFSRVDVYAHSTPVLIASGFADASGNITLTGVLPSLDAGQHTVSVDATTSDGTVFSETVLTLSVSASGVADPVTLNGLLSLLVPSGAAAVFLPPTVVDNRSTTLGTLGTITVSDARTLTRNGWDLRANVADFVSDVTPSDSISSIQLGMTPSIVSTDATGIYAGVSQIAGSAAYPADFAYAAPGNNVGTTVLDATLTFVAPQEKSAGIYRSTLTFTIVSK